jgi:hypothetical protein
MVNLLKALIFFERNNAHLSGSSGSQFANDRIYLAADLLKNVHVPPVMFAVSGQMVLPFYNMTDRLESPVAPSGSGGLGAAICRVPFPS